MVSEINNNIQNKKVPPIDLQNQKTNNPIKKEMLEEIVNQNVNKVDIQRIQDELNKIIANTDIFSRKIQLNYAGDINRIVITVIDKDSGEVLREIPSKELQNLARHLQDAIGVLYDKSFDLGFKVSFFY